MQLTARDEMTLLAHLRLAMRDVPDDFVGGVTLNFFKRGITTVDVRFVSKPPLDVLIAEVERSALVVSAKGVTVVKSA